MNKDKIIELCNQIESAAQNFYIKGCDDVARSNLTQLRGICIAAAKIRTEIMQMKEEIKDA